MSLIKDNQNQLQENTPFQEISAFQQEINLDIVTPIYSGGLFAFGKTCEGYIMEKPEKEALKRGFEQAVGSMISQNVYLYVLNILPENIRNIITGYGRPATTGLLMALYVLFIKSKSKNLEWTPALVDGIISLLSDSAAIRASS